MKRLDQIDWKALEAYGIKRESIEKKPYIAKQLAYGATTDPIRIYNPILNGDAALRFSPTKDEPGRVIIKGVRSETPKQDQLYILGAKITSEKAQEALFERVSYVDKEGKEHRNALGQANAGRKIGVKMDGETEYFLVSYNPKIRDLEFENVEVLKARFLGEKKEGGEKVYKSFGVALTADQLEKGINGDFFKHEGVTKDGEAIPMFLQYSVSARDFVEVHPKVIAQAMENGIDCGVSWKPLSVALEEKKAERKEQGQNKVVKAAERQAQAAEQKKGEGKGKGLGK